MTQTIHADASPEKRLFISLLTRDISLSAAFLDLVDNSVNAALVPFASRLRTADDYASVLDDPTVTADTDIRIDLARDRISIVDTAPGIPLSIARDHVFRFGRPDDTDTDTDRLSVYGLGLKRAIFKAGRHVMITSDHQSGGFSLDLDVNAWSRDRRPRWQFDLTPRAPVERPQCGTTIVITGLHPGTASRLADGAFKDHLKERIGRTYSYFLTKFVRILVNSELVDATQLRVGQNTASDSFSEDDVTCTITAGLGTPEGGKYRDHGSGWFVFCNGRTVISADKTPLTGWSDGLPIFQPKHRPFLGTVFFVSKYPDRLPWDTTKSGINEDSSIWQKTRPLMATVGRSITKFLDSRYSDEGSEVEHSDLRAASGERVDVMRASLRERKAFKKPTAPKKANIQIQYSARKEHVKRIAEYLARPSMSGSDVGRHTFQFFLENEAGED